MRYTNEIKEIKSVHEIEVIKTNWKQSALKSKVWEGHEGPFKCGFCGVFCRILWDKWITSPKTNKAMKAKLKWLPDLCESSTFYRFEW